VHRVGLMAFAAQGTDKFAGQILVEENLHAGCGSCFSANSARTPRTASSVRLG
jgi:hypothetical protein